MRHDIPIQTSHQYSQLAIDENIESEAKKKRIYLQDRREYLWVVRQGQDTIYLDCPDSSVCLVGGVCHTGRWRDHNPD